MTKDKKQHLRLELMIKRQVINSRRFFIKLNTYQAIFNQIHMMMSQKRQSTPLSTSDEMENESKDKKIKQTQDFIISRFKYLKGLDWYDILDQKKYKKTLDELSIKQSGLTFDQQLGVEIYNKCPKELRDGVRIQNIARVVSRTINDQTIPKDKRQKLQQIFLGTKIVQSPKPRYRTVLLYVFQFFGISALFRYFQGHKEKPIPTILKSQVSVGTQSIDRTQFSSGTGLQVYEVSPAPVLFGVRMSGLVARKQVMPKLNHQIREVYIENSINTRPIASEISANSEIKGSFVGKTLRSIGQFLYQMFFIQNQQSKKMEFSMGNTLLSLFQILPFCYMFYLILKGQDQSENSSLKREKNSSQVDKFYICQ